MEITKEEHFKRLSETTDVVWPIIESLVLEFLSAHRVESVLSHIEVYLRKRRGKLLLRPYLARIAYEASGGSDWRQMSHILAATELLNISTYQSNICFDEKREGWEGTSASNQFISSMLTFSLAVQAVCRQDGISDASKAAATNLLARVNSEVYLGQFLDLNILSLTDSERYRVLPESAFLESYLMRCRLIGGSMYRVACIGAYAACPAMAHETALLRFFDLLGVAGQILNDLADYMPDANRPYASQYGDLKMGRLTYPTYLLLRSGHPAVQQRPWHVGPELERQLAGATQFLVDYGVGDKCSALLSRECWKPMKQSLSKLATMLPEDALFPFTFARHYIFESRMIRFFRTAKHRTAGSQQETTSEA